MSYCGENSAVNYGPNGQTAVSLRCRSWTCPDCQPRRKSQLIAQAIGGTPNKFLTLTSRRREGVTPEAAAKELSKAWRIVRLRALREARRDPRKQPLPFGDPPPEGWLEPPVGGHRPKVRLQKDGLPFLAVIERHKSGWPHLHILLRAAWIDQKWISAQMRALVDGQNVWIEHLDKSHKAAIYASKYCGKCKEKIGTAKRYWQSRDYDLRPDADPRKKPLPGHGWERHDWTLQRIVKAWTDLAFEIEWQGSHKATCTYPYTIRTHHPQAPP